MGTFILIQFILLPLLLLGTSTFQKADSIKSNKSYTFALSTARYETNQGVGFCTATRIGENLFLTNNHCATTCFKGGHGVFNMGVETDDKERTVAFYCAYIVVTNEELDYSIFLTYPPEDKELAKTFPIAKFSNKDVVLRQKLVISSHPAGRTKEMDFCEVVDLEKTVNFHPPSFEHSCASEPGSSGSALFDVTTGEIVGLHWGSFYAPFTHSAIPASFILKDLKEFAPDVYKIVKPVDK